MSQRRRKPSKVERAFYAQSNFALLDAVLKETSGGRLPENYRQLIIAEMDQAIAQTGTQKGLPRSERAKFVQQLNKAVLAKVMQKVQRAPQQQGPVARSAQNGWSGQQQNGTHASFPPSANAGFYPNQSNLPPPEDPRDPRGLRRMDIGSNKREITALQDRQMNAQQLLPPRPDMHPKQSFDEFPAPPMSTRDGGMVRRSKERVGDAFKRIETQRAELTRKQDPTKVDFTLPQSQEEDQVNPEERFQQMMAERQRDDQILQQSTEKPMEQKDIVNDPTPQATSGTPAQVHMVQSREARKPIGSVPEAHAPFSSDNFVAGLDESMLNATSVKDTPQSSFDRSQMVRPPQLPRPQQLPQPITPQMTQPPPNIPEERSETRDVYLTIHSKFRDVSAYPSPYDFVLTTDGVDSDTSEVKLNDLLLFQSKDPGVSPVLSDDDLRNVSVVECLDVSLPKDIPEVFEEPYLWLCIPEWGTTNHGTGVPKGAFARLKPVPSNLNSHFVTMRAHVLERQTVNLRDTPRTLSISVLTADGQPLEFKSSKLSRKLPDRDLVYVRCLYPEKSDMISLQPSVFIYSQKLNKRRGEVSFRMYVSEEKELPKNKVGSLRTEKTKSKLPVNRYFTEDDLFFVDSPETSEYQYCKIVNVTDDTVTIKSDKAWKTINRLGFLRRNTSGVTSKDKKAVNYEGGVRYRDIKNLEYDKEDYVMIPRKEQASFMFRLLQHY